MAQKNEVVLIAAIGKNRELGRGNELVWRLSEDLKRFKTLTLGHPIIMGRKTFESIGKPLPKRVNIVVTREPTWSAEGVVVAHSVEQALALANGFNTGSVYVIGGGQLYAATLPFATRLELTHIDATDSAADVFFPAFEQEFVEVSKEKPHSENGVSYIWVTYKKA